MMLPIMVLLLVLIFVGVRYSLFHAVQCYELTKIEPIEDQIAQLYSDGTTSVRYNAENLYYTGYNYLVENKISETAGPYAPVLCMNQSKKLSSN